MSDDSNISYLSNQSTKVSRLREYTSDAVKASLPSVLYPAAVVSVIGWCLYLPGWIDADLFVAILRCSLAYAAGGAVAVPGLIAVELWRDRLRGKGARR
ncbi:hypothetical protein OG874_00030 [Nocardia sp. NBC_00565]|uniref:hypothetical protein n=1 Tax=Nocardia sp. NBC_00565 TaxID=2975993 RepID=UPI002E8189B5|nr:hypothetical protein [Nocardia sp. NBC_00565]WUC03641.1 hypothetical protein OG874_00030 [Nocardia sp. NBC_00565]